MTRNGKIARLPREVREELNRRLDNGEEGRRLLVWLNELPEVKEVLEKDFAGEPVSECNLTRWKNGGFADWKARREARALVEEWQVGSPMSNAQSPKSEEGASGPESESRVASGKVAESLTERLMAHYAAALEDAITETGMKPGKRVERLGQSLKDMARLRRHELAQERLRENVRIGEERVAIEREWLELERAKLKNQKNGAQPEGKPPGLSHQEKAEIVKQMVRDAKARVQLKEEVQ